MSRRIGIGLVLACGLALAGCGSASSSGSTTAPGSGSTGATSTTLPEGTVLSSSARSHLLAEVASGPTSYRYKLVFDITGLGELSESGLAGELLEMSGDFDATSGLGAIEMEMPGLLATGVDGVIDVRSGEVYVKVPSPDEATIGKPWIEESLSEAAGSIDLAGISLDPSATVSELRSLATVVRRIGPARFEGAETTRYVAEVPWADLLRSHLAHATAAQLAAASALGSIDYELYVDAKGRAVGVTAEIAAGKLIPIEYGKTVTVGGTSVASSTYAGMKVGLSLELSHFGLAVHVAVPAASQVKVVSGDSGLG